MINVEVAENPQTDNTREKTILEVSLNYPSAKVTDNGLTAHVGSGKLRLAHMGCKVVAKILPEKPKKDKGEGEDSYNARLAEFYATREAISQYLDRTYKAKGVNWKQASDVQGMLGNALAKLVQSSETKGLKLIDTMRTGSDYWRPGALLTNAVMWMYEQSSGQSKAVQIEYGRFDELCPSSDLLQEFKNNKSMTFGSYAEKYANELQSSNTIELALGEWIKLNARDWMPVFYCTDPYICGYVPSNFWLSDTPYSERDWTPIPELRFDGCHRVILVEELMRVVVAKGFSVQLYEVDPNHDAGVRLREY